MNRICFTPFPVITTSRLWLRQLTDSDRSDISLLRSDKQVNTYLDRPAQASLQDAQAFIDKINHGISNNQWIFWAINLKEMPALSGTICLWNFSEGQKIAEIGYELFPVFQHQGYMQEALQAVVDFGFKNLFLHSIEAYTHRENAASIRLLVKNKFKSIADRSDEENPDNIIFSLNNKRK